MILVIKTSCQKYFYLLKIKKNKSYLPLKGSTPHPIIL